MSSLPHYSELQYAESDEDTERPIHELVKEWESVVSQVCNIIPSENRN